MGCVMDTDIVFLFYNLYKLPVILHTMYSSAFGTVNDIADNKNDLGS